MSEVATELVEETEVEDETPTEDDFVDFDSEDFEDDEIWAEDDTLDSEDDNARAKLELEKLRERNKKLERRQWLNEVKDKYPYAREQLQEIEVKNTGFNGKREFFKKAKKIHDRNEKFIETEREKLKAELLAEKETQLETEKTEKKEQAKKDWGTNLNGPSASAAEGQATNEAELSQENIDSGNVKGEVERLFSIEGAKEFFGLGSKDK